MMNAYTAATELEAEQLEDLHWATNVLAGFGDEQDTTDAAEGMLTVLARSGCTAMIRMSAGASLCSGQFARA